MDVEAIFEPESKGYGRHTPTDAAAGFAELVDRLRPDHDADACMELLSDLPEEDRYVIAVRKGDPVAALYYGLGYRAAHALPGHFGCFLLTADQARAAFPEIEAALAPSPEQLDHVRTRIRS